jgi:hypothetical protein
MRWRRPPRRKLRSAFGGRRHSRSPTAALRIVMEIWNDSSRVLNGLVHRLERDLARGDGGQRGFPVHRWGRLADEPAAGFHSGKSAAGQATSTLRQGAALAIGRGELRPLLAPAGLPSSWSRCLDRPTGSCISSTIRPARAERERRWGTGCSARPSERVARCWNPQESGKADDTKAHRPDAGSRSATAGVGQRG